MPTDKGHAYFIGFDGLSHIPHRDSSWDSGAIYWGSLCMGNDVPKHQHREDLLNYDGPTCFECIRVREVAAEARVKYEAELARRRAGR